MDIIKSAKTQAIAYEDYSNGHRDHRHKGALDKRDEPGYVHDATALHKKPPQFQPPNKSDACHEDSHYKMLTEKVMVDFEGDRTANLSGKPWAKVFCVAWYILEKKITTEFLRFMKCGGKLSMFSYHSCVFLYFVFFLANLFIYFCYV
jgi:hypothetical protein